MSLARRSPRGFSLTEIMMAVGILGVGMTMVATIFPVAVDQTRRANDSTMAALCARSTAALIRARRADFVKAHRYYFKTLLTTGTADDRERPAEFGVLAAEAALTDTKRNPGLVSVTADGIISKDMRVYNPNLFLYEAGRRYDVYAPGTITTPSIDLFWPMWNAGNYIPVIYVTPIVPVAFRGYNGNSGSGNDIYNNPSGPWRVTIVVFKSRGFSTASGLKPQGDALHPRTKSWNQNAKVPTPGEPTFVAGAGDYIIDRGRHAGEVYLIDLAHTDPTKTIYTVSGNASNPPIFPACGKTADASTATTTQGKYAPTTISVSGNSIWYPLPGAVGAFHTIIGD